jgi:hypothetical protein
MKPLFRNSAYFFALLLTGLLPAALFGQVLQGKIANLRAYDKTGINVFETSKTDSVPFDGVRLRIGGAFAQEFQGLKEQTNNSEVAGMNLYGITPGFNTAMANLFTDVQLADGIRLNLTVYLSTEHHNETWVKGGYLQFDKLPFKGEFWDKLMKNTTIKLGDMEINYGDAHFRRTDAGQAIYNPFTEGNIVDAFATETGGEVYYHKNSFISMVGLTDGMIHGSVDSLSSSPQAGLIHKSPAIYGKLGFDKQVSDKIRVRLTGSYYHEGSSPSNDLYFGDRAGSGYFMVMQKPYTVPPSGEGAYEADAFSGRLNPGFSYKVDALMANAFVKIRGFELFGTLEHAQGKTSTETASRQFNQYAVDGVYRFGKDENLFVGLRYNGVTAELKGVASPVTINRFAASAGWFLTKNILMKGEYVTQSYLDFAPTDYRNGGKFDGYVVVATIGF